MGILDQPAPARTLGRDLDDAALRERLGRINLDTLSDEQVIQLAIAVGTLHNVGRQEEITAQLGAVQLRLGDIAGNMQVPR